MTSWITFAALLAASLAAGSTGAVFKPGPWYQKLRKPSWTPPNWAFPVVWTTLYLTMAYAAWRVALSPSDWAGPALALWAWQMVMNALWSPIFFGLRRLGAALVALTGLWIAVALTTAAFARVDPLAGLLMAPYVLWVTIAGALNFALWRMNPDAPREAPAFS